MLRGWAMRDKIESIFTLLLTLLLAAGVFVLLVYYP